MPAHAAPFTRSKIPAVLAFLLAIQSAILGGVCGAAVTNAGSGALADPSPPPAQAMARVAATPAGTPLAQATMPTAPAGSPPTRDDEAIAMCYLHDQAAALRGSGQTNLADRLQRQAWELAGRSKVPAMPRMQSAPDSFGKVTTWCRRHLPSSIVKPARSPGHTLRLPRHMGSQPPVVAPMPRPTSFP